MNKEDKKQTLSIRVNKLLLERLDLHLKENNDKRSRLIERLLKDYINKEKD